MKAFVSRVSLAVGLVGLVGNVFGDPPPATLKLADVIAVAVRQSPELANAKLDLEAAKADLLRAHGIEDFHVGAVANYQRTIDQSIDIFDVEHFDQVGGSVSVSRLLSTGGLISLSAGSVRTNQTEEPGLLDKSYTSSVALSLTQPLLRGGGADQVEAPIRKAAHEHDAAKLREAARAREVLASIAIAYWQVALAWRQLEVRQTSLELANKQLVFTEGAIRSDKVSQSEALAVEEVLAVRQQDVLAAEQVIIERSLALRQLAGLEIGPDAMEIRTEALPTVAPINFDLPGVVKDVFDHSAELAGLAETTRAAQADLAAADGAARSQLDLAVSGGPLGIDPHFGASIGHIADLSSYAVSASLTFDHAVERRTERGAQAAARAEVKRAEIDSRTARARLASLAAQTVLKARAALATIALGDRTIALAEQNITAEQHKFELAKSTNFEVLLRQNELETAKLRYASAVVDFVSAQIVLDGLTGAIFARYGVAMP